MENALCKAEFVALQFLIRHKELIIQKAAKGNAALHLNRRDYISKMKLISANTSKSKKIEIDDSKVLNHLIYKKLLINYIRNYNLHAQDHVFHLVFVKSTKVFLMEFHLFVLYCQL